MGTEFGKESLEGFPSMMGHVVPGIGDGFVGMARLLLLGSAALEDLLTNRPLSAEEFSRRGFYIILCDQFLVEACAAGLAENSGNKKPEAISHPSQRWVEETSGLITKILTRCHISIPQSNQILYYGGHSGIINAVHEASRNISDGLIDRCLVGGIDSCVEPRFLQAAASMKVLKTNDNPVGFLPGEAAGFFLIERSSNLRDTTVKARVYLAGFAVGQDPNHYFSNEPSKGIALEHAIRQALAQDPIASKSIALVIGDLNGNERRAMEWGHALVRLNADYQIGNLPLWFPAISFGETGATTGVLAICLAVKGFERGYARGGSALLWQASDSGYRGAIVLQSSEL